MAVSAPETGANPDRTDEVSRLLVGAVDLHCHSGPAAMPRILDHHEALLDAAEAGFKALLYKDHFYLGVSHAVILEKLFAETGVHLYSGLALNNASGGINPHAVDHAAAMGAKIIWLPTLSAKNHIDQASGATKNFPKTARRMLDPIPLSGLDENGKVSDAVKQVLDIIAEADIILAGGHLPASELLLIFDEAKKRGVRKMLVNHPTYVVDASDADIRDMVSLGAYMEHSICMFIDGRSKKWDATELVRLMNVAGVEHTVLGSDLGLQGAPRPVTGFREIVRALLDLQVSEADIRKITSENAAGLLNLDTAEARANAA